MYFLIVSDIVDIQTKKISHYSLDKGLNLGIGFANNGCNVDYVVSTETYILDNIKYINYLELTYEIINNYDYVIIVREGIIEELFKTFVELKKIFFDSNKKTKIIIKSDSCNWILDKTFRKYIGSEMQINQSTSSIIKWINSNINIICVQNKEFYDIAIQYGIKSKLLLISNMAVPLIDIDHEQIENPYSQDYSYCKHKKSLSQGNSLIPSYYIINDNVNELYNLNKQRIKIIYIGRIKTDQGKIIYMLRDIIEKLGDDYELHIFPGSFLLYNETICKIERYSANNTNHLEIMRDTIFTNTKNVFIHCPFNHKDLEKFLWHADIGIDFSSSRPLNVKADAGNAKLLEYCFMGLPVVTETNVNNSWLVTNCSNGILIDGIGTVEQYVESILKLLNDKIDRVKSSKITIQNENWNLRAKQFIDTLNEKFNN